jgi:ribosomal protein L5
MRIYDDLVGVAIQDDDIGFAFDDSGGLFRFMASNKTFEEIDRDKNSRIRGLDILLLKKRTVGTHL